MRRSKKQSNKGLLFLAAGVFLAFVLHISLDQHRLFARHHEEIAQKETEIAQLETEIARLEKEMKEVDTLPFIMKYALQYGMLPTDTTPTPVTYPEEDSPETEAPEEGAR